MSKHHNQTWDDVLSSAARLQEAIPQAVIVGGTAAAIYAGHRISYDHDHVLNDLKNHFDEIMMDLEQVSGWKTSRIRRPVLILGSLDGIETGVRQLLRSKPLETEKWPLDDKRFIILPTPEEVLRIKAMLVTKRNAMRDYIDCAAISGWLEKNGAKPPEILMDIDQWYDCGDILKKGIIEMFAAPEPYDLDIRELAAYKGLKPPLNNWDFIKEKLEDISSEMSWLLSTDFSTRP